MSRKKELIYVCYANRQRQLSRITFSQSLFFQGSFEYMKTNVIHFINISIFPNYLVLVPIEYFIKLYHCSFSFYKIEKIASIPFVNVLTSIYHTRLMF